MPMYAFKGIAASGKATAGVRDADSPKTLRQLMRRYSMSDCERYCTST